MTTEGSEALEQIQLLEESGMEVLSRVVCPDFFQPSDKLKFGIVSNMCTIAERLSRADKAIALQPDNNFVKNNARIKGNIIR